MKVNAEEAQVVLAVSGPERSTVIPEMQEPAIVKELRLDLNGDAAGVVIMGAAGGAEVRSHWKEAEEEEALLARSV